MINKNTERYILSKANVTGVMSMYNIKMTKYGINYTCKSPFRDDTHSGSMVISEKRNIVSDFATGESWNPKELVAMFEYGKCDNMTMKEHYVDILRILGGMCHVTLDNEPMPETHYKPLPEKEPKQYLVFPREWPDKYTGHEDINPLLSYLLSLPLPIEDLCMLKRMINEYKVGTVLEGRNKGWTTFWQMQYKDVDRVNLEVLDCKLMAYKEDGHRDKTANPYIGDDGETHYYSTDWMSSMLKRKKKIDEDKYDTRKCMFGLHLLDKYPRAEIRIVESEKTALICSAFSNPEQSIYMATGSLSQLNVDNLKLLMERNRKIVLIPDHDGFEKWRNIAEQIRNLTDYPRIYVSRIVEEQWKEEDGPKADIADIMLRLVNSNDVGEVMDEIDQQRQWAIETATTMEVPEKAGVLEMMIKELNLKPE